MISDLLRQVGAGLADFWNARPASHCADGPDLVGLPAHGHATRFGQRLADQATGALFYALHVRKP